MNVIVFDSIDSTNTYAKHHLATLASGTIIRARYQSQGRGQFTRTWQSTPNDNLLFTLVLQSPLPLDAIETIERITVGTIRDFLQSKGVQSSHKLPNDIYVEGKKIAGMLLETNREGNDVNSILVGVGFNINQTNFTSLPHATSLALVSGQVYDIDVIAHDFFTVYLQNVRSLFVIK
jgi:BirA family biotin operon repressor/biotin-[acetyl-CoA-carboxylase] ligase